MDYLDGLENHLSFTQSLGAHIIISNHSESRQPSIFDGTDAAVDKQTNFVMSRVFSNRLGEPYSKCVKDISTYEANTFTRFFLENNFTYTQKSCFNLCFQRRLVDECKCFDNSIDSLMYSKHNRACESINDFKCSERIFENFYLNDVISNCSLECPYECSSSSLSYTVTFSDYSTHNNYLSLLQSNHELCVKFFNKTYDELKNDLVKGIMSLGEVAAKFKRKTLFLNFYYEDLGYTQVDETPKSDISDLVSQVGGLFGLFIGSSFLSIVEIFDFLIQALFIITSRV
jgi:hypothetical protein